MYLDHYQIADQKTAEINRHIIEKIDLTGYCVKLLTQNRPKGMVFQEAHESILVLLEAIHGFQGS